MDTDFLALLIRQLKTVAYLYLTLFFHYEMVHQELNQCLERNVKDNLFLGRYPTNSFGVVDEDRMKKKSSELFRKLGMTVNLDQPMRNMSVSQRQMCEIARAISYNSKVIVLDEPTSSLMTQEVNKLFDMMRMLKNKAFR